MVYKADSKFKLYFTTDDDCHFTVKGSTEQRPYMNIEFTYVKRREVAEFLSNIRVIDTCDKKEVVKRVKSMIEDAVKELKSKQFGDTTYKYEWFRGGNQEIRIEQIIEPEYDFVFV